MLERDALTVFGNTDEFAEEITYYPAGELYNPCVIAAIVDRSEAVPSAWDSADMLVHQATIYVPRGTGEGCIAEVVKGKDKVELSLVREGAQPVIAHVVRVLNSDPAQWKLGVVW
jgi:hypothetical protein